MLNKWRKKHKGKKERKSHENFHRFFFSAQGLGEIGMAAENNNNNNSNNLKNGLLPLKFTHRTPIQAGQTV